MHNLGTDRDFLIDLKVLFLKTAAIILNILFKVVGDSCQKITLLLLKRKSVRVIVPESCF